MRLADIRDRIDEFGNANIRVVHPNPYTQGSEVSSTFNLPESSIYSDEPRALYNQMKLRKGVAWTFSPSALLSIVRNYSLSDYKRLAQDYNPLFPSSVDATLQQGGTLVCDTDAQNNRVLYCWADGGMGDDAPYVPSTTLLCAFALSYSPTIHSYFLFCRLNEVMKALKQ